MAQPDYRYTTTNIDESAHGLHFPPIYGFGATVASLSRRREPPFDGSVANDRYEIAPPHRFSLRVCPERLYRIA